MPDRYGVPMPESEMYKKSVPRDDLVVRFGETTVSRAEVATILNIMMITGVIKPSEFIDLMVRQCERIDEERRLAARLDEDRG
jgi:hypothetical protein